MCEQHEEIRMHLNIRRKNVRVEPIQTHYRVPDVPQNYMTLLGLLPHLQAASCTRLLLSRIRLSSSVIRGFRYVSGGWLTTQ